jgi:hypothetical protein
MTALGNANSRMKDFYDVWMLVTSFTFDGRTLKTAIEKTFQNRSTELPDSTHAIFSEEFVAIKDGQWRAFLKKIKGHDVKFEDVISTIRAFLIPVVRANQQGLPFSNFWDDGWM